MTLTKWQSSNLQIAVVAVTVALTISVVFFGYSSENLPTYHISLISQSSSTYFSRGKAAGNVNDQDKENGKEEELIILIWMWPFGFKYDLSCASRNVTGCILTDDKALYPKAHAVMFHHRDIRSDLQGMPTEPRPFFQKWVWYNMESPSNSEKIPGLNNLFNLTGSYRLDSDILMPYGSLVPVSGDDKLFTHVPTKNKLVCWIVSNWNSSFKRVQYYYKLKQHIEIKTYGRGFGRYISDEQYIEIIKSCKFHLSFENSIHKDYITEKFFRPLELGAVPVVLGPPRQSYEVHAPGDAFIHVDDFPSPKELADKLKHLDQHPDEYMSYFEWKKRFKVVLGRIRLDAACRTCEYLKMQKRYQTVRDLNTWYWEGVN